MVIWWISEPSRDPTKTPRVPRHSVMPKSRPFDATPLHSTKRHQRQRNESKPKSKHIGHGVIHLAQKGKKGGGLSCCQFLERKPQKKNPSPLQKRKKSAYNQKSMHFFIKNMQGIPGAFSTASQFRPLMEGSSGSNLQFQAEKRLGTSHDGTTGKTEVTHALADRLCRSLKGRGKNTFDQKPTNAEWSCWKTWATFCKEGKEVVFQNCTNFVRVDMRLISGKFFFWKKTSTWNLQRLFLRLRKRKKISQGADISEMALQDQLHPSWSQGEPWTFTKWVLQSMLHK